MITCMTFFFLYLSTTFCARAKRGARDHRLSHVVFLIARLSRKVDQVLLSEASCREEAISAV